MVTVNLEFTETQRVQVFVDIKSTKLSLKPIVSSNCKIGEDLKDKNIETLPIEVSMNFSNTKSIDVLIEALNQIKHNVEYLEIIKHLKYRKNNTL